MALPIARHQPEHARRVLINLNDIFMTDFAQLGLGRFDASRSTWHKVKAFPQQHRARGGGHLRRRRGMRVGDDSVIDGRGTTVVIHYGLCRAARRRLPAAPGRRPRRLLPQRRQGLQPATASDTAFVRYVNRWRLERADGRLEGPRQAVAAQEEDRLLDREDGAGRVPGGRPRGHPGVEQGVREDRLPQRHRGAPAGETRTSTPRTSTTTRSAGSPPTTASPWGRRGPTR